MGRMPCLYVHPDHYEMDGFEGGRIMAEVVVKLWMWRRRGDHRYDRPRGGRHRGECNIANFDLCMIRLCCVRIL